jgi:hypothetical protein
VCVCERERERERARVREGIVGYCSVKAFGMSEQFL